MHPLLGDIIESYGYLLNTAEACQMFFPTSKRFIVFYLGDKINVKTRNDRTHRQQDRLKIIGPQLTPVSMIFGKRFIHFSVVLKVGALYRLLGIPQLEMVECNYNGHEILGKDAAGLLEQLYECSTPFEMGRVLDRFLIGKLTHKRPAHAHDQVMKEISDDDQIAQRACLSTGNWSGSACGILA